MQIGVLLLPLMGGKAIETTFSCQDFPTSILGYPRIGPSLSNKGHAGVHTTRSLHTQPAPRTAASITVPKLFYTTYTQVNNCLSEHAYWKKTRTSPEHLMFGATCWTILHRSSFEWNLNLCLNKHYQVIGKEEKKNMLLAPGKKKYCTRSSK